MFLSHFSVKTKLIGGFLAVAVVVGIVGGVGYWGVQRLGASLLQVGTNDLPGVANLLVLKYGSELIKSSQRSLLNFDLAEAVRKRQYENMAKGREQCEAAKKSYDQLSHTSEQAELWQKLQAAWQQWERDNEEFLRLANELDRLRLGNPFRLTRSLEKFRADHYRLQNQVLDMLASKKAFDGGEDHTACAFGKWHAEQKFDNAELTAALREISESHKQFHESVKKMKALVKQNNAEAARKVYEEEMVAAAQRTFAQFDRMTALANQAQDLAAKMDHQAMEVCRACQATAFGLLDQLVSSNRNTASESVSQATQLASRARTLAAGVAAVGFVGAAVLGLMLALAISRPLRKTVTVLQAVASGDYSTRLQVRSKDEIGQMAAALNVTIEAVAKAMQDVKEAAEREKQMQAQRAEQERRAAEEVRKALDEAKKAAETMNAIPAPVMTVDREYTVTFMNPAGASVVGLTQQQCIGRKCYELFKTPHCRTAECRVGQAMERGTVCTGETVVDPGRLNLPIQYSGAPIKDAEGRIIGAVEYAADISEIKKARDAAARVAEFQEKEVQKLSALLQKVAAGDLTRRYEVAQATAETTEVARSFESIAEGLNATIASLAQMIGQITESAAQFAEGSRVIAESSQTLAQGSQTQSSSVEQMSASIEELTRSIEAVKQSAIEADRVAKQANALAQEGGIAVNKSIESMGLIRTSAQKIGEIIQVISEIASQTNLLALNAAIEAARAGEHGMGFAVVADEVRKLAERSNQAAREISSLIKESTQRVEEGAELSDRTGASLKQIIEAAETTAAKIAEIATATVQQAANAQEVAKAIQSVASVTEEAAAGAEQMASSSEELGAQAQSLRDLVARFKVDSAAMAAAGKTN